MSTQTVEVSDDGGSTWSEIDWQNYRIELGTQRTQLIPTASVNVSGNADVNEADDLRVRVDGDTKFQGEVRNGRYGPDGQRRLRCKHPAVDLFNDGNTITVASRTTENHLQEALDSTAIGGSFTLTFNASSDTFEYGVEERRKTRRIFRDIVDEQGLVFYIDPVELEIIVDEPANSGSWLSLDTATDKINIQRWDPGNVDTVRNFVTVVGTGSVPVAGSSSDSTSISTYGRRVEIYQYRGIRDLSTAQAIADSLLQPDPVSSGKIQITETTGTVHDSHINETITLTDNARDISSETLVAAKQTIEPGRATVQAGEGGPAQAIDNTERQSSTVRDVTRPGSVYDSERIADGAIEEQKLVDGSVIESKLADFAVSTTKISSQAVTSTRLADLSVEETKIEDDAISTPKLKAEAVTASEIEADTISAGEIASRTITALEIVADEITANEIDSDTITASEITAGTITALEIAADTLTANEIDTLDLETNVLTIGDDTDVQLEFSPSTDTTTSPVLEPTQNNRGYVGLVTGNRLSGVATGTLNANSIVVSGNRTSPFVINLPGTSDEIFAREESNTAAIQPSPDDSGRIGSASRSWEEGHIYDLVMHGSSSTRPSIHPDGDDVGSIGRSGNAWQSMRASNFVTNSPEPLASVDLAEFRESHWYDPPKYVCRTTPERPDNPPGDVPRGERGPDERKEGVEIGAMANYLYEVARELASENEQLSERVDRLEKRLSALEVNQ